MSSFSKLGKQKKLHTCSICKKVILGCLVVDDGKGGECHPQCIYPAEEYYRNKIQKVKSNIY